MSESWVKQYAKTIDCNSNNTNNNNYGSTHNIIFIREV